MPAPKPITVVLILAVFACVALYVLGLGLGAKKDSSPKGRLPMTKEERQQLRDRFFHPRPVKADELQTACPLASGVLTVERGKDCTVTIKEAVAQGRTVEVVPVSGVVSLLFTPTSDRALKVSESRLAEAKKLDVMKEGAKLKLTCEPESPASCQVRLR